MHTRYPAAPLVAIIGAAGQMTSVTARALISAMPSASVRLLDRDRSALETTFAEIDTERAPRTTVDLYDSDALAQALDGAHLVINGAGPFHKSAAPVRDLCIRLGIDYFDIDDDVESTQAALALDRKARERGVALFVGHGASPGFTNMMAVDLMRQLDRPEDVEVAWTVGDEGKQNLGAAVAEHALHIGAGPCFAWRDGRQVVRETFATSTIFPMGGVLGDYRVYECAHPEPVTIPWSFPGLRSATCWGSLNPQPLNGLLRGVARAVDDGRLTLAGGCAFMQAIMADRLGSLSAWRWAFAGLLEQQRRGEASGSELRAFLWDAVRSVHRPTRSGMAARVSGRLRGRAVTVVRQSAPLTCGAAFETMASITGLSAAAFVMMILASPRLSGAQPPERWADPDEFFERVASLGPAPGTPLIAPRQWLEGPVPAASRAAT